MDVEKVCRGEISLAAARCAYAHEPRLEDSGRLEKRRGHGEVPYRADAFARTTVHWRSWSGQGSVEPRGGARVWRGLAWGALTVRAVVAAPPGVAIAPVVAVTRAVAGAGVRTQTIRHGAEQPEQQ